MPRLYTPHFAILYAAHAASSFSILSFVLLPLRIEELGGDEFTIGVLAAVAVGCGIAIRWLSGHASDRIGRRTVMLAGVLLNVGSCIAFVFIDSLGVAFYLVRAIHGVAAGILFGGFFTVASDVAPAERRAEGLAIFGTSGMLGVWLGPLLGERALAAGGFDAFFAMAAAGGAVSFVLVWCLPETRGRIQPLVFSRALLARPGLEMAFGLSFLFGLSYGSYFNFLAPHLVELGVLDVSSFYLVYMITVVLLRLLGARVPDRVGIRRLLGPAFVVLLTGVALIGLGRDAMTIRIAAFLCGVGHGSLFPMLNTLIVRRTPEGARALGVSLFTAILDLGQLLGGPLLGAIAVRRGFPVMFVTVSVVTGCCLALMGLRERRRGVSIATTAL